MAIFNWFKRKQADVQAVSESVPEGQPISGSSQEIAAGIRESDEPVEKLLEDIVADQERYPQDIKAAEPFLNGIRDSLKNFEIKRKAAELLAAKASEGQEMDEHEKAIQIPMVAANCNVYVTPDKITAFACVFPPIAGGEEITSAHIKDALQKKNVTYGIDEDKVHQIADEKRYGVIFAAARGKPCIHGRDGSVTDHFPRETDVGLKEDERGNVDHKSLYRFHSVQAEGLICEITPPTEGEDGIDVTGQKLKAISGKMPKIPQGKNTVLSEDGTRLVASMDGDVSFHNNSFHVDTVLTISESVDNSVGNLDYNGTIVIQENVESGFKVNATGNIIVRGSVGNAKLCAGGNIEIAKGMNGNGQGSLEAHCNIKLSFMESVNVVCHQDVYAATIINSNILCGGSVYAKTGKGVIIGGSIKAGTSVEARRIGNLSGCKNIIVLGHDMCEDNNEELLAKELAESKDTLDKIYKNVTYLKGKDALPQNRKELLEKLEVQSALYVQKIEDLEERIEKVKNTKPDYNQCRVKSEVIHPRTDISLGPAKYKIRDSTPMCSIYYKDGELQMGTY